jgi:hypothetical protein
VQVDDAVKNPHDSRLVPKLPVGSSQTLETGNGDYAEGSEVEHILPLLASLIIRSGRPGDSAEAAGRLILSVHALILNGASPLRRKSSACFVLSKLPSIQATTSDSLPHELPNGLCVELQGNGVAYKSL